MAPRSLIALFAVAGCGVEDRPEYVASLAEAECDRIELCALGYFESEYSDVEDCLDERAEALEELNDGLDEAGCRFVGEEAGACVRRVRSVNCEDLVEGDAYNACDLVWDCSESDYPIYYGYGGAM